MDLDHPDLVIITDAAEGPDKISRLHRPPSPGGEDKSGFWPGATHLGAVGGLPLGLVIERLADNVKGARSAPGRGRPPTVATQRAEQLTAAQRRTVRLLVTVTGGP